MTDDDTTRHRRTRHRDERGVSFTLGYVLTVAIAVVLVGGVLVTVGQVVSEERRGTVRDEAAVVGDQTAAAVMAADRLVQQGNGSNITIDLRLPDRLADQPYTVTLRANASDAVVLVETETPSVTVVTALTNQTRVEAATVVGSEVRVVYNRSGQRLTLDGGDGG